MYKTLILTSLLKTLGHDDCYPWQYTLTHLRLSYTYDTISWGSPLWALFCKKLGFLRNVVVCVNTHKV